MSEFRKCYNCRFFKIETPSRGEKSQSRGECRYGPPAESASSRWPWVALGDICGRHESGPKITEWELDPIGSATYEA